MSQAALASWRARHIGFIFQLYNLIPVLTAYENVELPLTLTSLSRRERDEHVQAALEVVGTERSHGPLPPAVVGWTGAAGVDCPSDRHRSDADCRGRTDGDLDAKSAGEILDLLERLHKEFEKTIVMVTHDPNAAARAASLVHLEKGVLVDSVTDATV